MLTTCGSADGRVAIKAGPRAITKFSSCPSRSALSGVPLSSSSALRKCSVASLFADRWAARRPARSQYSIASADEPRFAAMKCQELGLRLHHLRDAVFQRSLYGGMDLLALGAKQAAISGVL